jgi:hypothetical protein
MLNILLVEKGCLSWKTSCMKKFASHYWYIFFKVCLHVLENCSL